MSIRWITELLGTAPALKVTDDDAINKIDVRDLVDKAGNRTNAVRQKIEEGCKSLREGKKTVVCCDHGISRSNAVAVGILAMYESIPFEAAARRVLEATGETEIKVDPLHAVRRALGTNKKNDQKGKTRILVTGGTGFLGKPIVKKLSENYEVIAPSRNEVELREGSTQLDLYVGENNINYMVHLANPRIYTSNVALGDSLTILRNILDVCITRNIILLYLSGWEVYSGYRSSHLVADESIPLLPKGPYGETKYLCEALIQHSRNTQGLQCAVLRSGPVYGVNGDKPKFIYNFIQKIKNSQNIVTHQYNNGSPSLDLLYIDDLVSSVSKTIDVDFVGDLNIGTGKLTSTTRIAEILRDLLDGKNTIISSTSIDSDIACIAIDNNKARNLLNWHPDIDIEHGLKLILTSLYSN